MKKRRLIALAAAAVMAASSLTGCGGSQTSSTTAAAVSSHELSIAKILLLSSFPLLLSEILSLAVHFLGDFHKNFFVPQHADSHVFGNSAFPEDWISALPV